MTWRSLCASGSVALLLLAGGGVAAAHGHGAAPGRGTAAGSSGPSGRSKASDHGAKVAGPAAAASFLRKHVVFGSISAASGTSLTVGKRSIVLASGAGTWQNGQQVQPAVGQQVAVVLSGGQGVFVDVLSPGSGAPQAGNTQVSGTVAGIRGHALDLAVGSGESVTQAVYALTDQTTVSGSVSSLAAITPGDQVTLSVGPGRRILSVDVTQADQGTLSGSVDRVTGSWLSVATATGPVQFRTREDTPVTVNLGGNGPAGVTVRASDLVPGDSVTVQPGPNGTASSITLTAVPAKAEVSGTYTGLKDGAVLLTVDNQVAAYRTADGFQAPGVTVGQQATLLLNRQGRAFLGLP